VLGLACGAFGGQRCVVGGAGVAFGGECRALRGAGHGDGLAPECQRHGLGPGWPLEPAYAVVFFDALRVKIREDHVVRNKAVYLVLGVRRDGTREVLGLWIETTEGAKFWMKVFNDLKTRGVNDILIAVTDRLSGMPAALEVVFPTLTGRHASA
jgi:hypothetical protein